MVKTTLVIPIERYEMLLANCDTSRPEYQLLRGGMITHDERGKAAEIRCDFDEAETILSLARHLYSA